MNARIENLMYYSGLTAQGCWDTMDAYDKEAIEKFKDLLIEDFIALLNSNLNKKSHVMSHNEFDSRMLGSHMTLLSDLIMETRKRYRNNVPNKDLK